MHQIWFKTPYDGSIYVQLVDLINLVLDLWGPPWCPLNGIVEANQAILRKQKNPEIPITWQLCAQKLGLFSSMWVLKCLISVVTIQMELYPIFGSKVVHFGPSDYISGGLKTYFRIPKGINLLKSYFFGVP